MRKKVLAALIAAGGVYFLYIPYALPVLDDWMFLQLFHQARVGGITGDLSFLRHLVDNTWIVQFRIFWASLLPVFALCLPPISPERLTSCWPGRPICSLRIYFGEFQRPYPEIQKRHLPRVLSIWSSRRRPIRCSGR